MLFLIVLRYIAPLPEVEAHLEAHRAYLAQHYARGDFLLSGRQEPRTGGAILARFETRADAEACIAADPFARASVAEYTLIAWEPSLRAHWLPAALAPAAQAMVGEAASRSPACKPYDDLAADLVDGHRAFTHKDGSPYA